MTSELIQAGTLLLEKNSPPNGHDGIGAGDAVCAIDGIVLKKRDSGTPNDAADPDSD